MKGNLATSKLKSTPLGFRIPKEIKEFRAEVNSLSVWLFVVCLSVCLSLSARFLCSSVHTDSLICRLKIILTNCGYKRVIITEE